MAKKEIMKQEPVIKGYADNDSSYVPVETVKQTEIAEFGIERTHRMSPKKAAMQGAGTSPMFLSFLETHPDIFLRKSSFDGMGVPFNSDDLDGHTAFLYECEILDYDALNPDTGAFDHYHYSVWLGVRDFDLTSFVYSAGKQLTELAEALVLPENKAVKDDVSEKGIHVKFGMIKLKSDPKKSFMKVDVIP